MAMGSFATAVLSFIKLVLSFAPWIAFLIIARDTLFRLKLGLVVGLAMVVVMGVARLHRGVILWAGLLFFVLATTAVVGFDNMWTARHLGVLANGTLAIATWTTIAIGKPFSLDYARDNADPALWDQPDFLRANIVISAVWAAAFSVNAALAWGKMAGFLLSGFAYEAVSYALLIGAAVFTTWYPTHLRRARAAPPPSSP
jgi:hypothetical protein